jgi:hypothetical protein
VAVAEAALMGQCSFHRSTRCARQHFHGANASYLATVTACAAARPAGPPPTTRTSTNGVMDADGSKVWRRARCLPELDSWLAIGTVLRQPPHCCLSLKTCLQY